MRLEEVCKKLFSTEAAGEGVVARIEYAQDAISTIEGWNTTAGAVIVREYSGSEPPSAPRNSAHRNYYVITLAERKGNMSEKVELEMNFHKDVIVGAVVTKFAHKFLKIPLYDSYEVSAPQPT